MKIYAKTWTIYTSIDVNIFSETRLSHLDKDADYAITGYTLFRNDNHSTGINTRPYGGTAVYSKNPFAPGYPLCKNSNGIEITIIKVMTIPNLTIIGVYRSPKVPVPVNSNKNCIVTCSSKINVIKMLKNTLECYDVLL